MGKEGNLHEVPDSTFRVRDKLLIWSRLEDDTTPNICELIKVLQKRNAIGDEDSSFRGKQTLGANDVVYRSPLSEDVPIQVKTNHVLKT